MRERDSYGLRCSEAGGAAAGNFAEWSVPWSDLMMIMFIVFAVLFIYAGGRDRPVAVAQARTLETRAPSDPGQGFLGQLESPVKDGQSFRDAQGAPVRETYFQSDNLGVSVVRETDRQVRVFLRGDLFFGAGGDALSSEAGPYLKRIAELLRVSSGAVLVVGHCAADETRTPEEGLALSSRRAASVAEFFIRTAGVEASRFMVTGRGAFQPEVPGADREADRRNRRVEVLVLTDI